MTALVGAALVVLPLLFRPMIGSTRAFLVSLLLAFSPVLLITSRTSSPDIWAILFAALALWGYWQAGRNEQGRYAIFAVVMFGALLFLAGPGGFALGLILAGAGVLSTLWKRRAAALGDEVVQPDSALAAIRGSAGIALALTALVVLALSTGLMLYPAGLSTVGEAIGSAVRAVFQSSGMSGYAVLIALFYEPVIWVFAIVGLFLRRDHLTDVDRFLTLWVIVAMIGGLVFADFSPDHALWITVPLTVLASNTLLALLLPDEEFAFVIPPWWARWLIAVAAIGVFAVFTLAAQSLGRALLQAPGALLSTATLPPDSVILLLVSVMFLVIGYFLFASLWGSRTSWRGIGLGLAIFGAITSLGAGWSVSVSHAEAPAEFWHMEATHSDTALLRSTLDDIARRLSGGFPAMPISVLAPRDGVVAWLLRDFDHADYISDIGDAAGKEVVLLPETIQSPQLEGAYVGQDFVIMRVWDLATLNLIDFPAWWTQGQTRSDWTNVNAVVLWLRQDVYQGVAEPNAAG